MKRSGAVIRLKEEFKNQYIEYHANVWKEVNDCIKKCNIQNYSIFYKDGFLFTYYEYTGDDYPADMKKMEEDQMTRKWWDIIKPMQIPLETRKENEWWAEMEEVYHLS